MIHIFCRKTKQRLRVFTIKRRELNIMILFIILTSSDIRTSSNKHFIIMIEVEVTNETHWLKSDSSWNDIFLYLHFTFLPELFFFNNIYFFQVKPQNNRVVTQNIRPINISSILTKMHPAGFQSIARRRIIFMLCSLFTTVLYVC